MRIPTAAGAFLSPCLQPRDSMTHLAPGAQAHPTGLSAAVLSLAALRRIASTILTTSATPAVLRMPDVDSNELSQIFY